MKTAISIPDPLFQAAEQFARAQGLSRSQLYAQAIQQYLEAHQYHGVTDALNEVYADEDSRLDEALAAAQSRAIGEECW